MATTTNLPLLVTLTFILNVLQGSALNWTAADEEAVCSTATPGFSVCAAKGPADENCKSVASKVNGADPQCYDENVCSFTKDGSPAYVTCNSVKAGYEILRNCINGLGIANPNPKVDLGDPKSVALALGKDGTGKYERPHVTPRLLCNESSAQTVYDCQGDELRNDLIKNFHPDRRLGNLCGGYCMEIKESNGTGVVNLVIRCVITGTYYDAETGQRDLMRLHLFNHGSDPTLAMMSYWGAKNMKDMSSVSLDMTIH
ncbi:hypothetical protein WDU94_010675 [Cyamophila willieti]